ncbi:MULTISPECIES: hypothetical protein [Geobacter]|uniref:Uncharacterized protein n=2 Tax=Geobacter TaxID=28231 RepID=A0A0C1TL01_9BACT|nr:MULTISPECIES: hypothetical protein [Geobacter]ANA39701.1 hypothetical protein A2G06_04245 [Geobacter anodireducens]KIE41489.1 hypothetical protein SE37_01995 [Geobacter soli]MBE2888081.1 hypothetical protein [Geobacter anodireducens]HMN03450.1 hypothetical protein [Geobacter anodireducens]
MFQESELFNLVLGVISLIFFAGFGTRRLSIPRSLLVAYGCLLLSYLFTVVEGFIAPDAFNLLEHLAGAAAGVMFAYGCLHISRRSNGNAAGDRTP